MGAGTPATTTSCTDYASRLTAITGTGAIPASQIVYDDHGNLTQLGGQTFTYDSSDRTIGIAVTNPDGSTQHIDNTLDSAGRVVTRTATGTGTNAENDTTTYAYAGGGNAATVQLTATHTIGERYLSLPGGVLLVKHYNNPGTDVWAYPDLHGHIILTAGPTGTITGTGYLYDPYGQPLDKTTGATTPTAAPHTRTNGPTDAWHGQNQAGYENTNGNNAILMGVRVYLPANGQFTSPDPILGGNANPYTYPNDPINHADLTGRCGYAGLSCTDWIMIGFGVVDVVTAVIGCFTFGVADTAFLVEGAAETDLLAGIEDTTAETAAADRVSATTARLRVHADRAASDYESGAIKMSGAQRRAADLNPRLEAPFRGQVIDSAVKNSVRNDPQLSQLWVSRSGEFGPDFYDVDSETWWDVTTPRQWQRHIDQYSEGFGWGIDLFV